MAKPSKAKKIGGSSKYRPPSTPGHILAQATIQLDNHEDDITAAQQGPTTESLSVQVKFNTVNGAPKSLSDSQKSPNPPLRDTIAVERDVKDMGRNTNGHGEDGARDKTAPESPSPHIEQHGAYEPQTSEKLSQSKDDQTHRRGSNADTASQSHPLFPPLPLYGPPSFKARLHWLFFQISAFVLSLSFLGLVVVASLVTSVPRLTKKVIYMLTFRDIKNLRPFYEEECRRADIRRQKQKAWEHRTSAEKIGGDQEGIADEYPPTEGGRDKIVCDVGYYARRVGLDVDAFQVLTEDGFLIDLWHVYDPKEYTNSKTDGMSSNGNSPRKALKANGKKPKFPVLLMHGLLQSSGAYCSNDDDSLAFWLCKSGFDVWLGNNRCGFSPAHESMVRADPRMWSWNIRHMGIYDLPALASHVLSETGFDKLGLICHSQGTAETLIALSKDQRPEFGEKLTVFCALAPAAYAGPLINRVYFKFMRNISPFVFQMMFGIHAFIPFMMQMHSILNPQIYGWLGYKVFSFLFDWSDARWDRGLRNRLFQFAPVYVSAETMRWWLGRDGFAKHKCILSTKEVVKYEEQLAGQTIETTIEASVRSTIEVTSSEPGNVPENDYLPTSNQWYNEQVPPFAMWVCGNDKLVDGQRLLKRFFNGREPHVKMVHSKVIDDYEHLDVIWAIDAVEQVFVEMREVLWKTCHVRDRCRVPEGCEEVPAWTPEVVKNN